MVTIEEFVKAGGKRPGEKGVTMESLKKDIARVKRSRKKAVVTTPPQPTPAPGTRQIAAVEQARATFRDEPTAPYGEQGIKQTHAQIPLGATDVRTDPDGVISYRGTDNLVHIIDPTGNEYVEPTGVTEPIVADDFMMLMPGGLLKKYVGGKALYTSAAIVEANIGRITLKGGIPKVLQINTKNIKLGKEYLKKFFGKKAMYVYGAWASAVFLGKWGQAESAEAIAIPMRDAINQAKFTGDWSIVDYGLEAANEITDLNIWEKIGLWSPISPLIGIANKIKGVKAGVTILNKIADNEKVRQETGQTEAEYWEQRDKDQAAQDKASVDYYNEQRKLQVKWENEAYTASRKAQRTEDRKFYEKQAKFWAEQRELEREREAEDRIAIAEFWIAYRKQMQRLYEDSRPSNLKFGLL